MANCMVVPQWMRKPVSGGCSDIAGGCVSRHLPAGMLQYSHVLPGRLGEVSYQPGSMQRIARRLWRIGKRLALHCGPCPSHGCCFACQGFRLACDRSVREQVTCLAYQIVPLLPDPCAIHDAAKGLDGVINDLGRHWPAGMPAVAQAPQTHGREWPHGVSTGAGVSRESSAYIARTASNPASSRSSRTSAVSRSRKASPRPDACASK